MLGVTGFFRRLFPFFVLAGIATVGAMAQQAGHSQVSKDWPQFGSDVAGSSAYPGSTGITAANIASLKRLQVNLDGTVDASVIYLNGVTVKGSKHDAFFVTTTYGKTIAVDANQGDVLWEYTPSKYDTWAGTRQITNSTPVADHDRQHIYAAAPDGAIRKLAISDGHALWTTPITLLREAGKDHLAAEGVSRITSSPSLVVMSAISLRTRVTSPSSMLGVASCCMCGTRSAATAPA